MEKSEVALYKSLTPIHAHFSTNQVYIYDFLLSKSCKTISETVHKHGTDCSLLLFFLPAQKYMPPKLPELKE